MDEGRGGEVKNTHAHATRQQITRPPIPLFNSPCTRALSLFIRKVERGEVRLVDSDDGGAYR